MPIKKCCGPTEVLDQWYNCTERESVEEMIANITGLAQISFQYNNYNCPNRIVNEYLPLNIFDDGFIEIEIDDNTTKILEDYHCLDVTELEENIQDGVHVITCDSHGKP